jgi:hypothetical protein
MIPGVPSIYGYLLGAIALAASAGGLWLHGHRSGAADVREEVDAARVQQVEAAMAQLSKEVKRGNELSKKLEERNRSIRRLAAARSDALDRLEHCGAVPDLFVRMHDDAATGIVSSTSETSGEPSCSPSPVTTAQAVGTIAGNYDACNQQANQLNALIDWVEGQP